MSELLQYIGALSSVAIVGAVFAFLIPLSREIIIKYISNRLQFDLDRKIEILRSELKKSEAQFSISIRANEQRLTSSIDTVLGVMSGRQTALEARRLKAVEALWLHKAQLDRLKVHSLIISSIKFDLSLIESSKNKDFQNIFKTIESGMPSINVSSEQRLTSIENERPFLSPIIWAMYAAYSSLLFL